MLGVDVAKKYIGLQEVRDNKQLKSLLHSMSINGDIAIDPAKTSWCAAWINFCQRSVGLKGTGMLNAQSFNTFGIEIKEEDAQEGDILVFHFPSDSEWQGHVTYFIEWDDDNNKVKCLGGNQSNSVCYASYSQDYIKHIRRSP
jgi:uncharacterized protein (TIGR02594 family)